jgi:hypothetical protein
VPAGRAWRNLPTDAPAATRRGTENDFSPFSFFRSPLSILSCREAALSGCEATLSCRSAALSPAGHFILFKALRARPQQFELYPCAVLFLKKTKKVLHLPLFTIYNYTIQRMNQPNLYLSDLEHDACGVGLLADIRGSKSHDIVEKSLQLLENMLHRDAESADKIKVPQLPKATNTCIQLWYILIDLKKMSIFARR